MHLTSHMYHLTGHMCMHLTESHVYHLTESRMYAFNITITESHVYAFNRITHVCI